MTGTNWESPYAQFLTLHYSLQKSDLQELKRETAGMHVLYLEGRGISMPQLLPNRFLTSIIVNTDSMKLDLKMRTYIQSLLDSHHLSHVKVESISEARLRITPSNLGLGLGLAPIPAEALLRQKTFVNLPYEEVAKYKILPHGTSEFPEYQGIIFEDAHDTGSGISFVVRKK